MLNVAVVPGCVVTGPVWVAATDKSGEACSATDEVVVPTVPKLPVTFDECVMLSTPVRNGPLSTVTRNLNFTVLFAGSANVGDDATASPENALARGSIPSQILEAISKMIAV